MANEITEAGQIVVYGGPQLTLLGSDLGNAVKSLLAREGSGAARGWKLFDPSKADFLNTKKVLNPGDAVLVNAKVLPMNFPVQTGGGGGGGAISWPPFSGDTNGPATELDGVVDVSQTYLPSFAFSSGSGTLQMRLNGGAYGAVGPVTVGNSVEFQIAHTAPFVGVLTLTAQ